MRRCLPYKTDFAMITKAFPEPVEGNVEFEK